MNYATFDVQERSIVDDTAQARYKIKGMEIEPINIGSPIIATNLEVMLRYAANILAPYLGLAVDNLELPKPELDNRAWCGLDILALTLRSLEYNNDSTLGHEVSHHLHRLVNPKIFGVYGQDMEASNLVELVAGYGAHLFSSTEHPEIHQAKQSILEEIKELDAKNLEYLNNFNRSQEYIIQNRELHTGGQLAADFLYTRFGEQFLKPLAEADVDSAYSILNGAGYKVQLFLPYDPNLDYFVNDDGELLFLKKIIVDDNVEATLGSMEMILEALVS